MSHITILPVEQIALDFYINLSAIKRSLSQRLKMTESNEDEMDYDRCIAFVIDCAEDVITRKLKWVDAVKDGDDEDDGEWNVVNALKKIFEWVNGCDESEVDALDKALDNMETLVISFINDVIPRRTWLIYNTQRLGNDLVIEKGRDYRIEDWYRRMDSGEWRVES